MSTGRTLATAAITAAQLAAGETVAIAMPGVVLRLSPADFDRVLSTADVAKMINKARKDARRKAPVDTGHLRGWLNGG